MKFDLVLLMRFLGEFTSTALLISVGCLGCAKSGENALQSSLHFGLVVMVILHCFGFVSGAHANPCISIACAILGYITPSIASVYVTAQTMGALVGYYILALILPAEELNNAPGLCMTVPNASVSSEQAFAIEFILTGIVVLGWCALWDSRNARYLDSISLRIGLLVTTCCLAGSTYTGASMNPVRSLAPAVYHQNFETIGIYLCSQGLAATVIPYVWTYLFMPRCNFIFASSANDNIVDDVNADEC